MMNMDLVEGDDIVPAFAKTATLPWQLRENQRIANKLLAQKSMEKSQRDFVRENLKVKRQHPAVNPIYKLSYPDMSPDEKMS